MHQMNYRAINYYLIRKIVTQDYPRQKILAAHSHIHVYAGTDSRMRPAHCCTQGLIVEGQPVTWPKKGDSPAIATVLPTVLTFVIMPVADFAAAIRVADLGIPD